MLSASVFARAPCTSLPADPGWRSVFSDDILTIFTPARASESPQLVARITWPAKPEHLYKIIWDYASFREHVPHVRKSEVLLSTGHRKWIYQQLDLPGPMQDRHYILESANNDSQPALQRYRVTWQLSDRFELPASQLVRPAEFSGCWSIQPGSAGGLDALYHIRLDPGGHVPHWMARAGMRRYARELMKRLHTLLQAPEASNLP
ncbi:polyketide cyclase/dehydrase/lipid transport protein [Thiogranum longum]|uniref:Polyketide cyclase/dehydrase/lipid transport protein n=2 Tax=Thiogranum longum TaxID=1537524 RepID=A0A4R1HEX9_9GAMM|nr:polyketide cyclase/dehydrase/lipid transport protein [Thiogranum longum]